MLYLYAIKGDSSDALSPMQGLDDAPVFQVSHQGVLAVVSAIDTAEVRPTPARLWRHEEVVEALMRRGPVLPARFSTAVADEEELKRLLEAQQAQLNADLERLEGCVELSVRVMRLEAPPPPARRSLDDLPAVLHLPDEERREYMVALGALKQQQQAQRRREEALGEILHRSLSLSAAEAVTRAGEGRMVLKGSYLVRQEGTGTFRRTLDGLTEVYPHLLFLCSGPWPPYSFVRLASAPEEGRPPAQA